MVQRIGRYELLKRLATGGMAELFLAKATGIEGFEKVLVLKRILPHLASDSEFVRMFLTEARLAATLDHANIVHVHDIGKEGNEYYFAMEYVHGEDLRRVIRRATELDRPIPLEHALTIITAVGAGLHHAHEQIGYDGRPLGIVHRDVSPSNIIVTYGGGVKVLDFGIAKAGARTNVSRLSTLKGKASYMSPEQCKGAKLDRRSDIFAIGILLQELLTMRPVYGEANELKIMHKVASANVPPIREAWPQCPARLQEILAKALRKEPQDRYPTALEFQLEIESFAHDHRVRISMAALAQYLQGLFGTKPYPWMEGAPKRATIPAPSSGEVASVTPFARPRKTLKPDADSTERAILPTDSDALQPTPQRGATVPELPPKLIRTAPVPRSQLPLDAMTGGFTQVSARPKSRRWLAVAAAAVVVGGVAYGIGSIQGEPTEPAAPRSDEVSDATPRPDPAGSEAEIAVSPPGSEDPGEPVDPEPVEIIVDDEPPEPTPAPAPAPSTDPDPPPPEPSVAEPPADEPTEVEVVEPPRPAPRPRPRRRRPNPDPDGLLP